MPNLKIVIALAVALPVLALAGCPLPGAGTGASPTPTAVATNSPSSTPTSAPTASPTAGPSAAPTVAPTAAPARTSGLVIREIKLDAGGDIVAVVKNLSAATAIDLEADKYQLCGGSYKYGKLSKTKTTFGANAAVNIHINSPSGCVESGTDFCAETGSAVTANEGNLSIYKGIAGSGDFGTASKMLDFVEWGKAGLVREDAAVSAGLWTAGLFVPVTGKASIAVKVAGNTGPSNWQ